MFSVALTGNVAAGKSTVLGLFAAWGATAIDADRLARDAVLPGTPALAAIFKRFGDDLRLPDGSLDRGALRRRVMGDDERRAVLNAIVHPDVRRMAEALAREASGRGDLIVVLDIPLLFEVGEPEAHDCVVLVDAPETVRRERLMTLRRYSREEAEDVLGAQLPSRMKRDHSHIVIDNDGSPPLLEARAGLAWEELRRRAARHALGDRAPTSLLAVLAHPDDESFGPASTLARYADAGLGVHLVCATGGEAAKHRGGLADDEALRRRREGELLNACLAIGIRSVELLRYRDKTLAEGDAAAVERVRAAILRTRPDAIVAFGPEGIYGHPDHVAVHAWTRHAWEAAGRPCPLYYMAVTEPFARVETDRSFVPRAEEEIAARLDTRPWFDVKAAAIRCHASQRYPLPLTDPAWRDVILRETYAREGLEPGSSPPVTDLFFA